MRPNNIKWFVLTGIAAFFGVIFGMTGAQSLSGGAAVVIFGGLFVAAIAFVIWSLSGNRVGKTAPPALIADARTLRPTAGTRGSMSCGAASWVAWPV